jgi:hypothetical protein
MPNPIYCYSFLIFPLLKRKQVEAVNHLYVIIKMKHHESFQHFGGDFEFASAQKIKCLILMVDGV